MKVSLSNVDWSVVCDIIRDEMNEKLGIDGEVHELKLGRSFDADGTLSFHSMYYDFKPASIDTAQHAVIDIEQGNKVKVTVPHIEGSSTKQTVYCGSKQPSQKDFALVINHKTGEFVLERLAYRLNLKRTRSEKARELKLGVSKQQKPATETEKLTNASNTSTMTTTKTAEVKQEQPIKASKNTKPKSPAVCSGAARKSSSKSGAKRALSASSSSEASSSSSSSSDEDDDDDQSGPSSESEKEKPQSAPAGHTSQTSKSASTTNFNICEDLELSESNSSSDSD